MHVSYFFPPIIFGCFIRLSYLEIFHSCDIFSCSVLHYQLVLHYNCWHGHNAYNWHNTLMRHLVVMATKGGMGKYPWLGAWVDPPNPLPPLPPLTQQLYLMMLLKVLKQIENPQGGVVSFGRALLTECLKGYCSASLYCVAVYCPQKK